MILPLLSLLLQVDPDLSTEVPADEPSAGAGILFLLVGLFFYFLPALVGRKKHNATSIVLLNLFLGWTFIGWVVALVWATSNDAPPAVRVVRAAPVPPVPALASVADELEKLRALHEKGALSETEFTQQKERLLRRA